MASPRSRLSAPGLACLLTLATAASGQLRVQVTAVPDALVLPLPPGRNALLTATVAGGVPVGVWLARAPTTKTRVPLVATGAGTWQLNLADPGVMALASAPGASGTLYVCAEAADGAVATSVPIAYSLVATARRPSLLVHTADRTERIESASADWLSPREVLRIDIDLLVQKPTVDATARLGEREIPLARSENCGARLDVTKDIAEAWLAQGTLEITARTDPDAPRFALRARPERLCPQGREEFEVGQRATRFLPGTAEYLRVRLGDISGGRVAIGLTTADHDTLVSTRFARAGDELAFVYAGTTYTLTVERLLNSLLGEDYATLSLAVLTTRERELIDRLLDVVQTSPLTFVRNGSTHGGAAAAQLLRSKYGEERSRIGTAEEFIAVVGTRSSTTGQPYVVRTAEGTERPLAEWLTEEVARLRTETPRK